MGRRFSFKSYQRTFAKPLRTARGAWSLREGFIVRVEDDSGLGYGEVAPIPEFGSETVEQARAFLEQLAEDSELATSVEPAALSCCAFGVSSALARGSLALRDYQVAALLPAGRGALAVATEKAGCDYTAFKWKIGVESIEAEQAIFRELVARLPEGSQLRLDANGGLSVEALERWLRVCREYPEQVEYMEQPLPVGEEAVMAQFAESSGVPIALDESLNGADGQRWLQLGAWSGPLVVKPALAGDARALVERLRPIAEQVVLSSVFETAVGLENALHIADQLSEHNRAIGFDTLDAFTDSLALLQPAPVLCATERAQFAPETIWKQLP